MLCGPVRCCAQDYYDDPKHAGEIKGLEPAKYLAGSCPLGEGGGGHVAAGLHVCQGWLTCWWVVGARLAVVGGGRRGSDDTAELRKGAEGAAFACLAPTH